MIRAGEARKGNVIEYRNTLWMVLDTQITYVGKRGAYVQVKMQNVEDQHIETQRFSTSDALEKVFVETKTMTYLYQDGESFVFMDPKNGDQISLSASMLEDEAPYISYNSDVEIESYQGRPLRVNVPTSVVLEVTHTEPAARWDTATAVTKPAELETGLVVKVPGHIKVGETIRVDTRTGEFLGRA